MSLPLPTPEIEQIIRNALERGRDPNTAVAAVMLNKEEAAVTKEERNKAKMYTFHALYSTSFLATVNYPRITGEQA